MLAVILFVCPSFLEATENVTESGGEDRLQNRAATGENEWIHVGCVSEMEGDKTELTQLNNIESHCKAHCKGKRSQFAGVQRNLCRCGNPAGRLYENANQCNQPHRWKFFALKGALGKCVDETHWDWMEISKGSKIKYRRACVDARKANDRPLAYVQVSESPWECHCGHLAGLLGGNDCYAECNNDQVCVINAGLDGESACEGHGFDSSQCLAVGCCGWDDGKCWSAVGRKTCQISLPSATTVIATTSGTSVSTESTPSTVSANTKPSTTSTASASMITTTTTTATSTTTSTTTIKTTSDVSATSSAPFPGALIAGVVCALIAILLIVAAIVVFFAKKWGNSKKEKERSDINPVYGTYEVTYDPVAEVEDRNLDYGVVYEGNERSRATDRNQDYDYDYMS